MTVSINSNLNEVKKETGITGDISGLTPMLAQYFEIKKAHKGSLLFFRMGDFYELFFDDAILASGALDITLTKRGRHKGHDIPMCGVPFHAANNYLGRLIRKGFRIAICDQMEDPIEAKKRGSKSVVKRAVTRIITPGTIIEDALLESRSNNYLASISQAGYEIGIAWVDVSTGDFQTQAINPENVETILSRIGPKEILIPDILLSNESLNSHLKSKMNAWQSILVPLASVSFDSSNGLRRLRKLFSLETLDGFGDFSRSELASAGALVDYLELTQKGRVPNLSPPRQWRPGGILEIDAATRKNLELVRTFSGEKHGSLLSAIDLTVTGSGARLLANRISAPSADSGTIKYRLDQVTYFVESGSLRLDVRKTLKGMPDLERAISRLSVERGGPRDLLAIRDGLSRAVTLRDSLDKLGDKNLVSGIRSLSENLGSHTKLIDLLNRALKADPPLFSRDGGFINSGFNEELDRLCELRDGSRRLIAELQVRYVDESGIASLKIKHNNVLGFFVEVTALHAGKLENHSVFIHRQTMTNATRYTTVELSELERDVNQAANKALAIEQQLFAELSKEIIGWVTNIYKAAAAIARLDVASGLAELASNRRYVRPEIDESADFLIREGRHPVVEIGHNDTAQFIANDCDLSGEQRLWLITGPNMAGKSTFLRQNALIAILAQAGSYVPASMAKIGIIDRIFSRVGASDDLARGQSTFMVEMVETAAILNYATEKSLVILDELGRGTATFDGLSLAWATIEQLHDANLCRTLFATHYHELTVLNSKLSSMACRTMRVKEWKDDIVFLHQIGIGTADRSYGLHVAKLAGIPSSVLDRARVVLEQLENGEKAGKLENLADDLPLFQSAESQTKSNRQPENPVVVRLNEINPDTLTPLSALELLYELKDTMKN